MASTATKIRVTRSCSGIIRWDQLIELSLDLFVDGLLLFRGEFTLFVVELLSIVQVRDVSKRHELLPPIEDKAHGIKASRTRRRCCRARLVSANLAPAAADAKFHTDR